MGVVFESDLKFGKNFLFNPWAPICHFLNYPTDHFQNLPKFKEYHLRKKSRKKLSNPFFFEKSLKQLASFIEFLPVFRRFGKSFLEKFLFFFVKMPKRVFKLPDRISYSKV